MKLSSQCSTRIALEANWLEYEISNDYRFKKRSCNDLCIVRFTNLAKGDNRAKLPTCLNVQQNCKVSESNVQF
jgi:hypothetical protein